MTITLRPDAPKDGGRVVANAIMSLGLVPTTDQLAGGATIDISQGIAIYGLGMDELRDKGEAALSEAVFVGWRYLIDSRSETSIAYADVRTRNAETRFTSIASNETASALLQAAHITQEVAGFIEEECEVRVLDVPAAKISSLWIDKVDPLFVPYIDGAVDAPLRWTVLTTQELFSQMIERLPKNDLDGNDPGPALMSR